MIWRNVCLSREMIKVLAPTWSIFNFFYPVWQRKKAFKGELRFQSVIVFILKCGQIGVIVFWRSRVWKQNIKVRHKPKLFIFISQERKMYLIICSRTIACITRKAGRHYIVAMTCKVFLRRTLLIRLNNKPIDTTGRQQWPIVIYIFLIVDCWGTIFLFKKKMHQTCKSPLAFQGCWL